MWNCSSCMTILVKMYLETFFVFSCSSDNVAELINNTAILEHNTASKSTCANFRNMVCTAPDFSTGSRLSFDVINKFKLLFLFNSLSKRLRGRTERDQSLSQRRNLLSCFQQKSPSQAVTLLTGYKYVPTYSSASHLHGLYILLYNKSECPWVRIRMFISVLWFASTNSRFSSDTLQWKLCCHTQCIRCSVELLGNIQMLFLVYILSGNRSINKLTWMSLILDDLPASGHHCPR